ncbi:MATE family efflux transporter [Kozakia baliensis]|uniref:MATE family efflux transporter n=1 Tax=Kozakia baliensis TaxID=153496 RepID=UPI00089DC1C3|nr:MATE family efflux transporter [Kozakia baliensis]
MSSTIKKNGTLDGGWRAQIRALIRIATPLSLSQLSEMSMNVTDTVLLGGLGATALAVGGMSTNIFFCTFITFQAALGGASVLIARARGEAHAEGCETRNLSALITSGFVLALILCLPVLAILLPASSLLHLFGEPPEIVHLGSRFLHILLWALLPDLAIIGLLRIVLPALGSEHLLLWTMPGMAVMNGILNAALIHGWAGLPKLGLWGSAVATVITGWSIALLLLVLARRQQNLQSHLRLTRMDRAAFWEMLRLGLPMMGSTAAELLAFQMTGLQAGSFGPISGAAHQVALSVTSTAFMVSLALSQGANIRVAYWLGAGRPRDASRAATASLGLVLAWTSFSALVLLLFAHRIATFYIDPSSPGGAEVVLLATSLLKIAGVFQIVDGVQVVCAGALRGCHDTFVPMVLMIATYIPVAMGFGSWLAFHAGMGARGLWTGLASGLTLAAALLATRLFFTLRRQRRSA